VRVGIFGMGAAVGMVGGVPRRQDTSYGRMMPTMLMGEAAGAPLLPTAPVAIDEAHQMRQARRLYIGNVPFGCTDVRTLPAAAQQCLPLPIPSRDITHTHRNTHPPTHTHTHRNNQKAYTNTHPFSPCLSLALRVQEEMAAFFAQTMLASRLGVSAEGPVVGASVNQDKNFAFIEFRTPEDATAALALDGVEYKTVAMRISRPKDYLPPNPDGAAAGPLRTHAHSHIHRYIDTNTHASAYPCACMRKLTEGARRLRGGGGEAGRDVFGGPVEPSAGRPQQDLDWWPALLL
jgi:hypothetical protein